MDTLEPGLILAAMVTAIEDQDLSGYDRIRVLQAHQRLVSYFQAMVFEDMASISDLMNQLEADPEIAHDAAAAEIGAALRLTRRAADSDLALAVDVKARLPEVWEALASGRIDLRRARVVVQGTAHLSEEAAREVVGRILDAATRLTTGQLGALIRRVCVQNDPDDANTRYREAVDGRRIEAEPSVEGTAHLLGLDLPPDRVEAAMRRIADIAQGLKTRDETRTIDQIRADVFLDLLDGHHFARSGGRRGTVDIHVDLTTLARLAEDPGELAGYGPCYRRHRPPSRRKPAASGMAVDSDPPRQRPNHRQRHHPKTTHHPATTPPRGPPPQLRLPGMSHARH
jgi:hypothetical protein